MADNPIKLGKQEYTDLLIAERKLLDMLDVFDKAESCQIDCQQLRAMTKEAVDNIQQLKSHFGPRQ